MIIKTRGIVFRAIKYSESSLITDIYTEAKGLRRYIISGVRSKKARTKASLLQVMSLVDMVAYDREDRDLNRVKEIKAAHVYRNLPFEIRRGAVGLFIAEVARKTIRESEENPKLFQFLYDTFTYLDQTSHSVSNLHLTFLLDLSTFLGFLPGGHYDEDHQIFDLQEGLFVREAPNHIYYLKDKESALLWAFMQTSMAEAHTISVERLPRQQLVQNLLDYFRLHLENFPEINAHQVLKEVLEG